MKKQNLDEHKTSYGVAKPHANKNHFIGRAVGFCW